MPSSNPYAVVWGFLPEWNLTVVAPFVTVDVERTLDGQRVRQTQSGFGDAQVFLKYDGLYKKMCGEASRGWQVSSA